MKTPLSKTAAILTLSLALIAGLSPAKSKPPEQNQRESVSKKNQ